MARSRVTSLIEQYNSLSEVEQKVFLDLVDPQPEPEAPAKKTRKPRAARTPRIAGLPKPGSEAPKSDAGNAASTDEGPKCGTCGNVEDFQDHFKPSPNYHAFDGPKKSRKSTSASSGVENASAVGASAGD